MCALACILPDARVRHQENKDNFAWGVSIYEPVLERNPSLAQILPCCFFDADWLLSDCDVSAWTNPRGGASRVP